MRVGVIDAGSNTVRLVVADAEGQVPLPVHTAKRRLRLAEHVGRDGRLAHEPVQQLTDAVAAARQEAQRWGVTTPLAFGTAVLRDAPNCMDVLQAVQDGSGVRLAILPGEVEAELAFLAARRWMGWRAGPLALLDIGGGSLEVAVGRGRLPGFAVSLPLGAGRLTREFLHDQDPPSKQVIKALRRHVRHQLRDAAARVRWETPHTTVVTSRTFQQLARLSGASPGRHGPFVQREMARSDLREAVHRLRSMPATERADLPGISAARAGQSLAGAVVGHTALKLMGIETVTVCPWAVREGILLRLIEEGDASWWTSPAAEDDTADGNRAPLHLASTR